MFLLSFISVLFRHRGQGNNSSSYYKSSRLYLLSPYLFFLIIYFIHISVYMSIPISQFITPQPPPPATFPPGVHTFVLYICVSISALQTGSSVPFFQVPHICVNIRYLFFSFWLTSLCMIVSRSIHVSTNVPVSFRFMAE